MPVRSESGEELLTTLEAAQVLGISVSTIRVLIFRGKIEVERLDARTVLVPRREVERYRQQRGSLLGQGGRPRKSQQSAAKPAEEGKQEDK